MSKDLLSGSDADFGTLLTNLIKGLPVPDPALAAAATAWKDACAAAYAAQSALAAAIAAKRTARRDAMRLARQRIRIVQADPAISPAARKGMGLKVRDTTPTPVPAPDSAPLLIVTASGRGQHTIGFGSLPGGGGRPRGAVGIELYLAPPPPPNSDGAVDPATLSAVERTLGPGWRLVNVLTRPGRIITPAGVQSGDLVRYIARWRTAKGLTGPWSETVECTLLG